MDLQTHILIARILLLCSLAFFAASAVRYFTHMLQLNGYNAKEQLHWTAKNKFRLLPCALLLPLGFCFAILEGKEPFYAYLLFAAAALLLSLFYFPKKAKKPLVFTARVKRLLITFAILLVIAFALSLLPGKNGEFLLLSLAAALVPFLLLLANRVNEPLERAVRNHYIRDAKKILAACPDLKIIGVTGSFGKTSVKFFLTALLEAKYNVLCTPESYNTPMGVVKTVREHLRPYHEIFVCEMGAKWVGDIKELCDIVHPQSGVVTSIGEQHLETFGSIENIIKTKYELADALPADGKLYINISSETVNAHRPSHIAVTYGLTPAADYYADGITVSTEGSAFTLRHGEEAVRFTTPLIGASNVVNIVGAIAAANGFGIPLADLVAPVRRLRPVPHRMELCDRGAYTVIDDAFNSNPAGAAAALDTLSRFDGLKIIVTPGMVELGDKEEELNFDLGVSAAAVCDRIVTVGRQAAPIAAGAKSVGFDKSKLYAASDLADAMRHVQALDAGGKRKIILLENDLPDNY